MGADIQIHDSHEVYNEPVGDLVVRSSVLHAIDTDDMNVATFIDEIPVLAVAAMFAEGRSRFTNLAELRVKESDRLQGVANLIGHYGGEAAIEGNTLTVAGGRAVFKEGAPVAADHRLAMTAEILNLVINGEMTDDYQQTIAISAPEFYETIRTLTESSDRGRRQ
jgi:3-phosphoshikimate 1-carboxyvinyltransferase